VNAKKCKTNEKLNIKMRRLINRGDTALKPQKKKNKSEIISIRLTHEKKVSLVQYAIEDDRTISSLISKILGNWLRDQREQDEWR
jgi:hypothetical protein